MRKYLEKLKINNQDIIYITESEKKFINMKSEIAKRNLLLVIIKNVDIIIYFAGEDPPEDSFVDLQIKIGMEKKIPIIPIKIPGTIGIVPNILKNQTPLKMASKILKQKIWIEIKQFYE
ncbi:MAG: hypothetical protein K9W44_17570 [Candidatus Lokiarchaeota archaeon]|nr:hypothetical protein [Candidatus Harpocratesius repetitus]